MKETTEEQQKSTEAKSRDEEDKKSADAGEATEDETLDQRLAQVQYFQTLVSRADQKAAGAFNQAGIEGLVKLLGNHIRGFERSPEGAFKMYLDEVVEIGGLVFDKTVSGKFGAKAVSQLSGVRAADGRQVSGLRGEEETVVAETDAEPIRLTPVSNG